MSDHHNDNNSGRMLKRGPILLIEDDPEFRNEAQSYLQKQGYEVICQDGAKNAVSYMQKKPWSWSPWLIITDLVMDGMGGYQLIRRIQEIYPDKTIPVIVISQLKNAEDVSEAELAGANAYLGKPVSMDKLLETVKYVTTRITSASGSGRHFKQDLG
ncbi:MAG: response regulator [bacterium]|nr:response regulator [bacterium]